VGGACSANGEKRKAFSLLLEKPERKKSQIVPRNRWMDNIKMDIIEIGCAGVDWIGLAQDKNKWRALVNAVMNFRIP
jgi:hypothetical protein